MQNGRCNISICIMKFPRNVASFEKRIQHLLLSIIFIINSMQHICAEQLQNQIAKECTLNACIIYCRPPYYFLP